MPKALGPIEGEGFVDWKGVVGTGPMILADYVRGSSLTWQRNPNYWKKDPLHPANQLPYLDSLKVLIIPDLSTQLAALRTGKVDMLENVDAEDAKSLSKTNPKILLKEKWTSYPHMDMRIDKPPFDNVKVRQAMMMAINYQEIAEGYYGGDAEVFWWPTSPVPEHSLMYVPLEQQPESVQELYGYHPDKAAKLLDEAGLPGPNRFTTSIIVSNIQDVDLLALVKSYWAKIGVTLNIDVKEVGVKTSMDNAFSYKGGTFADADNGVHEAVKFLYSRVGSRSNYARINDPLIEQTLVDIRAAYFDWAELSRIQKERARS